MCAAVVAVDTSTGCQAPGASLAWAWASARGMAPMTTRRA